MLEVVLLLLGGGDACSRGCPNRPYLPRPLPMPLLDGSSCWCNAQSCCRNVPPLLLLPPPPPSDPENADPADAPTIPTPAPAGKGRAASVVAASRGEGRRRRAAADADADADAQAPPPPSLSLGGSHRRESRRGCGDAVGGRST